VRLMIARDSLTPGWHAGLVVARREQRQPRRAATYFTGGGCARPRIAAMLALRILLMRGDTQLRMAPEHWQAARRIGPPARPGGVAAPRRAVRQGDLLSEAFPKPS